MRRCASTLAVIGVALAALAASSSAGGVRKPAPPAGALLESLSQPPVRASIASRRIYFVMTDRYRNGDPSNDRGGVSGDQDTTGFGPGDIGDFHGGDFKGLTGDCTSTQTGLARLKELGFNGIWVTPPVGQKAVQGDSAAYHGYWGLHFDHVDAHLGTDQDFGAFVDCAHRLGMKVYVDVVVNHTADVIQLGGGSFVDPAQKPYRNCRGKKFNPARYVKKKFPCLKASKMPYAPSVPPSDRNAKSPAWMNDVTKYHNRGDIDFSSCSDICFEQGDFFGLDDLFTEQPAVMQGLADVYADWIRRYKLDGFRVDTARHVNAAFFRLWAPKIVAAAAAAGVPDFEIFGEVPITDDVELSAFVRDRGLPNLLDFPFQSVVTGFAAGQTAAQAVANRLTDDDYFRYSPRVAPSPVTFLGNHDMGRAALQLLQHGSGSGDALLRRLLLGYDVLYLLRGAPAVYYGDEVGMIGTGGDKEARQDMFPTQVGEWKTQERVGSPPIGNGSSFDEVGNPIEVRLRELAALKDAHPALSTGATIIRRASGGILAVSRIDAAANREYLAIFNSGTSPATVTVQTATPSSAWTPLLGTTAQPLSGDEGTLSVSVPDLGTVLLGGVKAIAGATPARPVLKVAKDSFSSLWRASATVSGNAPVSVSFAIKRKTGGWQLLAADDSPPFRAFLDRRRFAKKQKVYLVAIARSLGAQTAVSKVVGFVPRKR